MSFTHESTPTINHTALRAAEREEGLTQSGEAALPAPSPVAVLADAPAGKSRYRYLHARVSVKECAAYLTRLDLPPEHIVSVTPVTTSGISGGLRVEHLDIIYLSTGA